MAAQVVFFIVCVCGGGRGGGSETERDVHVLTEQTSGVLWESAGLESAGGTIRVTHLRIILSEETGCFLFYLWTYSSLLISSLLGFLPRKYRPHPRRHV